MALISDLHAGAPYIDAVKIARMVEAVNQATPDLVLLLGDYTIHGVVAGDYLPIEAVAPLLDGLEAPLGRFAVLGNHDWWDDAPGITAALRQAGITVLDEELVRIARPGGALWLAGLADLWEGRPDPAALLAGVSDAAPVLVLSHNPDVFPLVPARAALTVAGHTHGGQVKLPLLGRPVVPSEHGQRFAYGHVVEEGRHLYVTAGLGTSILPVRFGVPPEVVHSDPAGGSMSTARRSRAMRST